METFEKIGQRIAPHVRLGGQKEGMSLSHFNTRLRQLPEMAEAIVQAKLQRFVLKLESEAIRPAAVADVRPAYRIGQEVGEERVFSGRLREERREIPSEGRRVG